jgi:alkylation response protein AidB-like acyl-CoA dehydrogenase
MNLALSDEQVFLREAARGALSRFKTLEAAREALDGKGELPDLWPTACEAGWPGLLIDEAHGGAGLDAFDAMLVLGECGRVLAGVALLGHLPASAILQDAPAAAELLPALASGERRAAYLPACPPNDVFDSWCIDPRHGSERPAPPTATADPSGASTGSQARVNGTFAFVPDAPGADLLVGVVLLDGRPTGVAIEASAAGVQVEAVMRYDATRSLGHVTLSDAAATVLDAPEDSLAGAWHLAQALLAAESIGAVETALDVSVAYAKERHTFGRAIGSYQAVKHSLTEVLRQLENGRSLLYYAGWARRGAPSEFALAAAAARSVAGGALDTAARTMISVHGGIGATWEHDAPLYFRRAQLSRRLLGGAAGATDRVAGELLTQAAQAA